MFRYRDDSVKPTPNPPDPILIIPEFIPTILTRNGYYKMIEEEENEYKPKLIENYQEMEPYDINVNIPEPEPIIYPTVKFDTITNNGTYTLNQLTTDTNEYFSRDSVIKVTIPLPLTFNYYIPLNSLYINETKLVMNKTNGSNLKFTFKQYSSISLFLKMGIGEEENVIKQIWLYELYSVNYNNFNETNEYGGIWYYTNIKGNYNGSSFYLYLNSNQEAPLLCCNGYTSVLSVNEGNTHASAQLFSDDKVKYILQQ